MTGINFQNNYVGLHTEIIRTNGVGLDQHVIWLFDAFLFTVGQLEWITTSSFTVKYYISLSEAQDHCTPHLTGALCLNTYLASVVFKTPMVVSATPYVDVNDYMLKYCK